MSAFVVIGSLAVQAAVLVVGPKSGFSTISAATDAASAGDTVRVLAGVYRERPVIETSLVLIGEPGAVIDGGADGTVLTIKVPATVRGFTIRSSGNNISLEHSGIWAIDADGILLEDNVLEDVLFGIYIKQSLAPVIRRNRVTGKDVPMARRGDGIRLWYSHSGTIENNEVRRARDVVIWFSDDTFVRHNVVADSRYGLHYMYSNRNRFEDNQFLRNEVGAFLMYSVDITFHDNVFAYARGVLGKGLGFKDAEDVEARRNLLVKNAIGVYLDNSPHSRGVVNLFRDNVLAFNDVAVTLLPSVRGNIFEQNTFLDNVQPVGVTGGGTALQNTWRNNFWSGYAGFDEDRNGVGDAPFVHERLSDDLLARHEALKVYELSPAIAMLNVIGRFFPLLQPKPIVVDSSPRLDRSLTAAPPARVRERPLPLAVIGFAAVSVAAASAALRARFRTRSSR